MSKRGPGATFGGGEERYGGPGPGNDTMEKPMKATDAQMARRKIAAAKKRPGAGSRGPSPFTAAPAGANAPQSFTMANGNGTTSTNNAFAFGATTQPTTFQFGASQPSQANPFTSFGQSQPAPAETPSFTGFGQTQTTSASTPSFTGFGQSQPAPASTPSFTGFGQTQPAPASTSTFTGFGQTQTAPASTPSFTGFGQSQPAPTTTSAPSNPFGQSQPATANQTSFSGFGQSKPEATNASLFPGWTPPESSRDTTPAAPQPEAAKSTLFGGFNQTKSEPEKPSNPFSEIGQQPQQNGTSNLFGGFNQTQAEPAKANPFGSMTQSQSQSQSEPAKANNPFASFGQTQSESSRASTPFAQKPAETEKPATNLFAGLGQPPSQQNGASSPFSFGQKNAEPEKASNPFGGLGQASTEPAKSTPFAGFGQTQSESSRASTPFAANQPEAEKPKDLFASFGQKPQQNGSMQTPKPNGEKTGLFGASIAAPAAQTSGGSIFDNLPKKAPSRFVFSSSDPKQVYNEEEDEDANGEKGTGAEAASSETPKAAPPRSLFDRIDKPISNGNQDVSATPKAAPPKNLFGSIGQNAGNEASSQTPKAAPPKNLFERVDKDDGKRPASKLSQSTVISDTPKASPVKPAASAAPAPASAAPVTRALAAPAPQSPSAYSHPPLSDLKKAAALKNLNEGVIAQLKNQDPSTDLSTIFLFAAHASAGIMGVAPPSMETSATPKLPAPPSGNGGSNLFSSSSAQAPPSSSNGSSTPAPAPASSQTAMPPASNMFNTATPKFAGQNLFNKAPSTAPPAKKRMFEVDDESPVQPATEKRAKSTNITSPTKKRGFEQDEESSAQPSTEKRAKASYPALSESASNTTRLFAATLEKSKDAEAASSTGFSGFKPSTSASGFTPSTSATSGFKPSTSASSPTKTTSTPQAPQGAVTTGEQPTGNLSLPTFTAASTGGSSFLSSFGANAKKNEEAARKKRMDEDYDSDDCTKEEWEKRDREEQEKKRQKILDAAKSASGFKVPTFGTSAPTEAAASAPTAAEKSQGTGNNTWSMSTPIKFGTTSDTPSATPATVKPAGGLFASFNPATPAAPTPSGSLFGATPAAPTPAAPTTAEGSDKDEEESAEDPSAPQDDFAGLLPAELKDNTVMKELQETKTSKFEEIDQVGDDGKKSKKWVRKASGRLFVLKNKETDKIRILCKAPQGQVLLNYNPIKGTKYEVAGKKELMVSGAFMDHIYDSPAKMGRFIITTASVDDAKDLARYLTEGASQ